MRMPRSAMSVIVIGAHGTIRARWPLSPSLPSKGGAAITATDTSDERIAHEDSQANRLRTK